jgi:hypothetical protein
MARVALVGAIVCVLVGCSDGTAPGSNDPIGLWNASLTDLTLISVATGQPVKCSASWVMSIIDASSDSSRLLFTMIPRGTKMDCGPGPGGGVGVWVEGGRELYIHQAGDSVSFVTASLLDTFFVAELRNGSVLSGRGSHNYRGADFSAIRRSSPIDPNTSPNLLRLVAPYVEVEVGDSTAVGALVYDAYDRVIPDLSLTWSSSAPGVAAVGSDGVIHGLAPGQATLKASLGDIADTAHIEVLQPAASVEITLAPDSLIYPAGTFLLGVARDANGQELPNRQFHWTTSNAAIATVEEYGVWGNVTTLGPGSVTITARSSTVTASVTITVLSGS